MDVSSVPVISDGLASETPEGPLLVRQPVRWLFHALLTITALMGLWSTGSFPPQRIGWGSAFLLLLFAIRWLVSVVVCLTQRLRRRPVGRLRWLLAAPCAVPFFIGVVVANVPFSVRWAASKSAFERTVESAELVDGAASTGGSTDRPIARLGAYSDISVRRDGEAVIFTIGVLLCGDAGVAYLPDRTWPDEWRDDSFFSADRFDGDWYSWTRECPF